MSHSSAGDVAQWVDHFPSVLEALGGVLHVT